MKLAAAVMILLLAFGAVLLFIDWVAGRFAQRTKDDYERKTGEKWPYPLDKP